MPIAKIGRLGRIGLTTEVSRDSFSNPPRERERERERKRERKRIEENWHDPNDDTLDTRIP